MVTPDRSRYTGGSEGAPPTPPPGGYKGARRVPTLAPVPQAPAPTTPPATRLSWIALAVSSVFGFVLLIMALAGATGAIYGIVTLAFQLGVIITVIAALVDARGRRIGSIALVIALVLNVGTLGAASAVARHPTPDSVAGQAQEDDPWAAYPGIRGQTEDEILARPSLEAVQRIGDALMADVRERLSDEFGFEWVAGVPGAIRAERNGYGGESMLVEYRSGNWATTEPITDYALKLEVMAVIDEVVADHGFWYMVAFNDPSSGFDPAYLERLYGGTDPRTQPLWEWYTDNYPDPIRFYASLTDLSHDDDGSFRAAREGQVAGTAEPLEGLRLMILVPEVLSEADVEEFLERMEDF